MNNRLTTQEQDALPLFIALLSEVPMTSNNLMNAMRKLGFQITAPQVRKLVNHIRGRGLVENLIASSNGYYIENNPKKVRNYVYSLLDRASEIRRVALSFNV